MKRFAAIALPLLVAYAATLWWVVERWNAPTRYYEHGWLLPFLAAFLIWRRRAEWRAVPAVADRRALWLVVPALLLHLAGALLTIDSLSATSLVLVVPGAAWLAFGRARLAGLWPVLMLVLFAVPPPLYLEGKIGMLLKELAVTGGAGVANLLGAEVTRAGADLAVAGQPRSLYVAEACGGLRSLLAMVTLGYCIAFFRGGRSSMRRLVLLLFTVPLAVSANIVRIASLCLMARHFGVDFAEGTGHTLANIAEWVADVAALLVLDALLTRWTGGDEVGSGDGARDAPAAVVPAATPPRAALRAPAIALWLIAPLLLLLSLYRPSAAGQGSDRAAHLPTALAGFEFVPPPPAVVAQRRRDMPQWIDLLGTDDFVVRQYRESDGRVVNAVALYHDANWKSVHPPRICIEGSGFDIVVDEIVAAPWLDGGSTLSRIVARGTDGWLYVTLSAYGTRDWSAGSYWRFFLYHLPRALLRRADSGFLLRAETPVYRGESVDEATRRSERFLRALVPIVREAL
ncbi:MAG: EpsI family protein [Planctomycetes bacterium]|nr:EpsI family protein [Planctomycetota bacterium]